MKAIGLSLGVFLGLATVLITPSVWASAYKVVCNHASVVDPAYRNWHIAEGTVSITDPPPPGVLLAKGDLTLTLSPDASPGKIVKFQGTFFEGFCLSGCGTKPFRPVRFFDVRGKVKGENGNPTKYLHLQIELNSGIGSLNGFPLSCAGKRKNH